MVQHRKGKHTTKNYMVWKDTCPYNDKEEYEKYDDFITTLEEWRIKQCDSLYENAKDDYEYYTCDNYIRTELEEGNYEFLADGTDF